MSAGCKLCGKPLAYADAMFCGAACCAEWEGGKRPTVETVDIGGVYDKSGAVQYIGLATKQPDGTWRCLANVNGALCIVEANITFTPETTTKVSK